MAGKRRHLRLVADDEQRTGSHPVPPATVDAALTAMRLCAAALEAQPADLFRGYTEDETVVQYAAAERMVQTFRTLDRLLTERRGSDAKTGVSGNGHHHHPPHEEK